MYCVCVVESVTAEIDFFFSSAIFIILRFKKGKRRANARGDKRRRGHAGEVYAARR